MGSIYLTTISDFASGPPANPSTGDSWFAANVDTNGTRWHFQYNAASASAYKWEFVGGPPIWTHYDYPGGLGIGNSTYTAITNLAITVGRAGDYIFTGDANISTGQAAATEVILALAQNSTVPATAGGEGSAYLGFPWSSGAASGSNAVHFGSSYKFEGANASDVFKLYAWAAATGTNSISLARFSCIPVRVS